MAPLGPHTQTPFKVVIVETSSKTDPRPVMYPTLSERTIYDSMDTSSTVIIIVGAILVLKITLIAFLCHRRKAITSLVGTRGRWYHRVDEAEPDRKEDLAGLKAFDTAKELTGNR